MTIRSLTSTDINRVAAIHREELPEDFCALLGVDFLTKVFYPELLRCSLVKLGAVSEHDVVQGFIFFSTDRSFFRRLVSRYAAAIARSVDWRAALRGRFLRYAMEVLLLLLSEDHRLQGAEVAYLAVAKRHQGRWVSLELFREGFVELQRIGVTHCWLKTLESTPLNIALYERAGFERLKSYLGRVYMTAEVPPPHDPSAVTDAPFGERIV